MKQRIFATLIVAFGLAPLAGAQEYSTPDGLQGEGEFQVGGSCAALAYLSSTELRAYINASYSDDFHSFCFPEEPSDCEDYTQFLKGLGRLSTGEDGYHCSLQLQL